MFSQQDAPITVLHVDDDEAFLDLSKATLEVHEELVVETETDAEAALERLRDGGIDCVVSDYQMDEMDGLAFLTALREFDSDLPVVFFTGHGSERVAAEAIHAGVTDYLQKGTDKAFLFLRNRVQTLVANDRAARAAQEAEARVRQLYERISDGFLAVDADWTVTYLNSPAETLFDCTADDVVGRPLGETLPALTERAFGAGLRAAVDDGESRTFEAHYPPLDRWISVVAYPADDGVSLFARDITEYKRAETKVEEMRNRVDTAESQFRTLREKVSRPAAPFR
ncbi:PAS domain S-box-containing protein [Halogranum gelatinilyticum]|uniref:PAS domain S-box-containing protein n=1 Tax=Halogranum gelatinilyticum TaxID=660521 RepID=A0A1G9XR97_9EURY|nr:response regulator [Halogranum gelatinilyticum]SDM99314.1 PAS domain S-box-containing protein [Halogranum gelatinilyticum]